MDRKEVMNVKKAILAGAYLLSVVALPALAGGDAAEGAKVFGACAACHSLEPGHHMTGPSLAQLWKRKAGTAAGFARYSDAVKKSNIVWNEKTLDAWLKAPEELVPGNFMTFPGVKNPQARADLIAFLKTVGDNKKPSSSDDRAGGMMGAPRPRDLKKLAPEDQVTAIRYCGDTYHVTTADGKTFPFWEFNLRFKTDSSDHGPTRDKPALVGAGMRGDRATVVFSGPAQISSLIKQQC